MRLKRMVVLGVVAAAVAGCGGDDDGDKAAPAERPASPTAREGEYVGSWYARMTADQLIDRGADPRLAGTFRLTLGADGTYTTFTELDGEIRGRYKPAGSGKRLVFGFDEGCKTGGFSGQGVYAWSVRDGKLRLRNVRPESGGCTGRTGGLTTPVWERR